MKAQERRRLWLGAWLLALLALAACAAAPTQDSASLPSAAKKRTELRVGVNPDYPPVIFEQDGRVSGIEADLARELGTTLGWRIELVELPWQELIPALQAGRIDIIMSGMSVTPERAQQVLFLQPYMQVGQMALVRKAEITELGSEQSLYFTSGRVGFVRDTTGETFVRGSLRLAQPVPVDSPEQGVEWLSAGKIDVFVHDAPTIWRISSSGRYPALAGLYWPLTQEDLAWAVKRGNQDLAREVDAVLTLWKQTGRLQLVLNRWMKTRVEYAPGG